MAQSYDYASLASLFISISAVAISIVRFRRESKLQTQADMVSALTDIVKLIDNDNAVEARGILRADKKLNELRDGEVSTTDIAEKTWEAARYIATTYDRLGFILRHDSALEAEILGWQGDVIVDMWKVTRPLIQEKWRKRTPRYAEEFERLAKKAELSGY
jgi:hypothetical protein